MRRILLAIVLATVAFPAAANASVLSTVSNGTLTITGDAADDRITVRPGSAGAVLVNDQSHAGVTGSRSTRARGRTRSASTSRSRGPSSPARAPTRSRAGLRRRRSWPATTPTW